MTTISFSDTLYFNNDNILSYSLNNIDWIQVINYPITLTYTGLEIGNIYLISDITFTTSNNYFIIGSENITFDGGNKTVIINNVTNYPGLFQNGTGSEENSYTNGYSNVTIKNIIMKCSTSTLMPLNGWFAQTYFSNAAINNLLSNLSSNGPMSNQRTGGICGSWCGVRKGSLTITNCNSSGIISNFEAGGICGARMGNREGIITISNCFSTGNISGTNSGPGGICGNGAGYNGGIVTIQNCYSTGNISARQSGGICGDYTGGINGTVTIKNCYSTGLISGVYSGGICGFITGHSGGSVIIDNCYSTGNIYSLAGGGICGVGAGTFDGTVTIKNCYSTGLISGSHSGGIGGPWFSQLTNKQCSIINCYSRGNVTGFYAGGICGGQIGWTDNTNYSPHIVISNCYSSGEIALNAGSILGGYNGNSYLSYLVTVDIINCYSVNGPLVAPVIFTGINLNFINSGFSFGIWNDIVASSYLSNAPIYSSNGNLLKQGSIWLDPSINSSNVPFIFNTDSINQEIFLINNNHCHHKSLYNLGHHTKTHFSIILRNSSGKKWSPGRILSHITKKRKGEHYKNYLIDSMGIKNLCRK